MNEKEKILISNLLYDASETFSNHGCNDLNLNFIKDWTEEELQQLNIEMHEDNNSPKEDYDHKLYLYDWILMRFLSKKINKVE